MAGKDGGRSCRNRTDALASKERRPSSDRAALPQTLCLSLHRTGLLMLDESLSLSSLLVEMPSLTPRGLFLGLF